MSGPTKAPHETYRPGGSTMRAAQEGVDVSVEPPMPTITVDTLLQPETEWERWLQKMIYVNPGVAMPKFQQWVETLPYYAGADDDSDMLPPGAPRVEPPAHWLKTPIHFTPLQNPRYSRVYYASTGKYTFNNVDNLVPLLAKLYAGQQPKRILDVGTGIGASAFAFGKVFPDAEVIGVDLGAHFVRLDRKLRDQLGASNVEFYWQHGGDTVFEDESFDIVHEGYVLHEQPVVESQKIIHEMKRLLKPGGRATWIDVIYDPTPELREARVQRAKGPEPFLAEYMKLNLGEYLKEAGFIDVEAMADEQWDGMIWTGIKPA